MVNFNLTKKERIELYELAIKRLENFYEKTRDYAVSPNLDTLKIRNLIASYPFENNKSHSDILNLSLIHISEPTRPY